MAHFDGRPNAREMPAILSVHGYRNLNRRVRWESFRALNIFEDKLNCERLFDFDHIFINRNLE